MASVHDDAEAFLNALAPDGQLTFQTFDDAKKGRKGLSRLFYGPHRGQVAKLGELNDKGAGCFVMVNRGDGKGRKAANVEAIRAVFLDLDGSPIDPVLSAPIPPAIVCESSPGKFHAYWPIDGMPLNEFKCSQKALAAKFGGDERVCDLPRVMRIPGYLHLKAAPFRSHLLQCHHIKPWNWHDFADAMGLRHLVTPSDSGPFAEGERNTKLFRFACGLKSQGISENEATRRLLVANETRCTVPLEIAEIERIVSSAWQSEPRGFITIPHSLIDNPAFLTLPADGKTTLLALMRRYYGNNNGRLTFTCEDAAKWGLSARKRRNSLKSIEDSGLLEYTQRSMPGSVGRRAVPDLFRLPFLP